MTWPVDDVTRSGPLAGLRILDLSRILAGPFATQVLADLGADVIKVERPGVGDESRRWGPPWAPRGEAAYYYACNRGRRSVCLDLTDDADRELVLSLAEDAQVLMENFLPGAMERLGLTDDVLWARNPALVHGVISGYGHASSRAAWPALDFVVQAHAGVISVTGPEGEEGVKAGLPIADLSAGLFAVIGVLAAVREAEATGRGRRVEVALAEACGAMLCNQALNFLIGGLDPAPMGNAHPNVAPYEVYAAADRPLALAASSEVQFERLCGVVGLPELVTDERFATNAGRLEHRQALTAILEERLAARSATEWVRALNEAGVAAAPINTVPDMFTDPDTVAGLVTELPDGTPQLRTPIRLDGKPLPLSAPPPRLGEHDEQVRRDVPAPPRGA